MPSDFAVGINNQWDHPCEDLFYAQPVQVAACMFRSFAFHQCQCPGLSACSHHDHRAFTANRPLRGIIYSPFTFARSHAWITAHRRSLVFTIDQWQSCEKEHCSPPIPCSFEEDRPVSTLVLLKTGGGL